MAASHTPRADIQELEEVVTELASRFDGIFTAAEVYKCVFESYAALRRGATVHLHLVPLARHQALDLLTGRSARWVR